jgi:hypothetical protein
MPMRRRVPEVDFSGTPVLRLMTINTLFKPSAEHRWKELAAWVAAVKVDGAGRLPA